MRARVGKGGRRAPGVLVVLSFLATLAAVAPASSAGEDQLPNLVALPPFDVRVGQADGDPFDPNRPLALRFSIGTVNRGSYAFELFGTPKTATSSTAEQCVRWASAACIERREVGELEWHPEHLHWHLNGYARYSLRRLHGRAPDMTKRGLVAESSKVSFCLMDGAQDAEPPPGTQPGATAGAYRTCSGAIQGISPGWRDVYEYDLPGQQIPLAGISDGRYALVVTVDPDRRLLEVTRDDDVAFTVIKISSNGTEVGAP